MALIADPKPASDPWHRRRAQLRWRTLGRGKRGGYRVIYFARLAQGHIWMLTIYPKNVAENIPAHILARSARRLTMPKGKRNIGLEILQGLRKIKRGDYGRVTTLPSVTSVRGRPADPRRGSRNFSESQFGHCRLGARSSCPIRRG